ARVPGVSLPPGATSARCSSSLPQVREDVGQWPPRVVRVDRRVQLFLRERPFHRYHHRRIHLRRKVVADEVAGLVVQFHLLRQTVQFGPGRGVENDFAHRSPPVASVPQPRPRRDRPHAFSASSCFMPLGGRSALRQLAKAVRAPANWSASLSSHSIDTAPSKPTRLSSMKISSRLLASRAVPAVTNSQPLVQASMPRCPPSRPPRQCSRATHTPLTWAQWMKSLNSRMNWMTETFCHSRCEPSRLK